MRIVLQAPVVVFLLMFLVPPALAEFFVVGGGKRFQRIVTVRPQATETDSGAVLRQTVHGIGDSNQSNRYLVHVEPGTYDMGAESLDLPDFVSLQGSGRGVTIIKSTDSDHVVEMGLYTELRHLSVSSSLLNNKVVLIPSDAAGSILNQVDIALASDAAPGSGVAAGVKIDVEEIHPVSVLSKAQERSTACCRPGPVV